MSEEFNEERIKANAARLARTAEDSGSGLLGAAFRVQAEKIRADANSENDYRKTNNKGNVKNPQELEAEIQGSITNAKKDFQKTVGTFATGNYDKEDESALQRYADAGGAFSDAKSALDSFNPVTIFTSIMKLLHVKEVKIAFDGLIDLIHGKGFTFQERMKESKAQDGIADLAKKYSLDATELKRELYADIRTSDEKKPADTVSNTPKVTNAQTLAKTDISNKPPITGGHKADYPVTPLPMHGAKPHVASQKLPQSSHRA